MMQELAGIQSRLDRPGPGSCLFQLMTGVAFVIFVVGFALFLLICAIELGHSAELRIRDYQRSRLDRFGQYGDAYYERRWFKMCKGPARYDAMREAYELGKKNPC
jgi:hypothetical protein